MMSLMSDQVDAAISKVLDGYFRVDCGAGAIETAQFSGTVPAQLPDRWCVILAGGDGTRLQGLTQMICGDERPKQFCPIVGLQTLLEQTTARAERLVAPEQTFVALARGHARYYKRDLAHSRCRRLIQPCNRGTAPAIIVSLLQIARLDPAALVAILPSDHYYSDEAKFTAAVSSAFEIATMRRRAVVLLGSRPAGPEIDFGWIELGSHDEGELYQVRNFHEKPTMQVAERLFASGALLNTFVMVGSVSALLGIVFKSVPELAIALSGRIRDNATENELQIPEAVYQKIYSADFSRRVLSPNVHTLLALRLQSIEWHDLGQPDRVVSVLSAREEAAPNWMNTWQAAMRT